MASLYEIDAAILSCVDLETGEIVDADRLSALQMERNHKIESVALWVKDLKADMAAYKAEKEAFAEREKQAANKVESLSKWLTNALGGSSFNTNQVAISFRKSEAVEVDEEVVSRNWMKRKVTYTPDKVAIKNAIKEGKRIRGAELVERSNIQIK